jgi:IPT/TIG domain/Putative Ig domain/Pectate lyase superfamily protein
MVILKPNPHRKKVALFPPAAYILPAMILSLATISLMGCASVITPSQPNLTPKTVPLQIQTSVLPTGTVGTSYSLRMTAGGGTPPYSWSTSGGALPSGLTLNASTGTMAGTPAVPGTFAFTTVVKDAKSAASSAGMSLDIIPELAATISGISPISGPASGGTTVIISGSNFRSGASVQFGSFSAVSVRLVNSSQIETVTPAEPNGAVDVTVKNSAGQIATGATSFNFLIPALQIFTTSLPVGSVENPYSSTITATGGTPPYSWGTTGGSLPTGLLLSSATGVIAGTPTVAGSFSFTAQVKDAKATSSSTGLSLNISTDPAPTISAVSPIDGPDAGGTPVIISGSNFRAGATVLFGSVSAASVQLVNSTKIQVVTPAESTGTVNVSVQDSDSQVATDTSSFTFNSPTGGTTPITPTASSDPAAPKIFNASSSAHAGDIISVQGANFDSTSQVWLAGDSLSAATQVPVINRVGKTFMAVQLPRSWPNALILWVSNSHGASKSVLLNGAIPTHLDAMQIVPGGAFRVLGRNLLVPGFTPVVTVDGQAASINADASDENMLVVNAPNSLSPTKASVILVDNGNGTGATQLDRTITVVAGSGDPFALGVGWGAGFTFAGHTIKVNTPCNGSQDDTNTIQAGINSASSAGGVVQLPAGTCRITKTMIMRSKVVLQGAGKDVTTLRYEANYPIFAQGADLIGLEDLTFVNAGATMEGPLWKRNTRSFLQRVKIDMGVSQQLFFTGNQNIVVAQTDFIQRGAIGGQGPYLFVGSSGLVFSGNTTTSIDGSPSFQSVHDALFLGNHFTRDATNQNEIPVIVTHRFVMDFAYRIAVVGNTFDVINGPITNKNRNDGETLLTEGGGSNRTENIGFVSSATGNSIADFNNTINVNPFGTGTIPENYGVAIVNGTGAGQTREIVAYSNHSMQVDQPWDVQPDSTSRYATFVWGLEKSILKGNTLSNNPRGIWLYQTAIREVDISGNTITNGGGIYLRTFQSQSNKQFDPIFNVRIRDNNVTNSSGLWMSYTNVIFVNLDKTNFGISDIGIEIRNNSLTANNPNVTSTTEEYANREGFMNMMRSEVTGGQLTTTPMVLGTIFQADQCLNCDTAFAIGTGDYGTVLVNNQPAPSSPNFLSDWKTLAPVIGGSIGSLIQ